MVLVRTELVPISARPGLFDTKRNNSPVAAYRRLKRYCRREDAMWRVRRNTLCRRPDMRHLFFWLLAAVVLLSLSCAEHSGRGPTGIEAERGPRRSEEGPIQGSGEAAAFLARKERWAVKTGADRWAARAPLNRPATA